MERVMQISDIIEEHKKEIYARKGKPPEFSLNFLPSINKKIWGFKRKKMVVVGGRPGNGKSTVLLQMGYDFAKQGHTVYFFSFEMSMGVCAERIIANRCSIDNFRIGTGQISPLEENDIKNFQKKNARINFHILDRVGQSLPKFQNIIQGIHGKPDIVIIDYGNLVEAVRGKSKKEAYDEYIKGLRALAIRNNFCVVLGTQINRGVAFRGKIREPMLEDLKDTGELEQTADMAVLLHYPYQYTNQEEDKGDFIIRIAKNRDGRVGRTECKIRPELCRVAEVAE